MRPVVVGVLFGVMWLASGGEQARARPQLAAAAVTPSALVKIFSLWATSTSSASDSSSFCRICSSRPSRYLRAYAVELKPRSRLDAMKFSATALAMRAAS